MNKTNVNRALSSRKKASVHPYAAIDHRVIDSEAFSHLTPSAVKVLLLIARQHNGHNNGQLHAAYSFMHRYGIGSEHTLQSAISQLIAHGFLYRTRSHGANRVYAKYALTWLRIDAKEGLFLAGWKPFAWRDWQAPEKKAPLKKCSTFPAETADLPTKFLH